MTDPLQTLSAPGVHWTTTNIGEAMPGVQTPLSWTVWQPVGVALREAGFAVGALSRAERVTPDPAGAPLLAAFYGRAAFQVEFFARLGDRLPGTTGPEAAASLLGRIPPDLACRPTRRRYPIVAWRFPSTFALTPGRVRRAGAMTEAWYRDSLRRLPVLDEPARRALLWEASARLVAMVTLQTIAVFSVVQPLYDAVERLVEKTGVGDVAALSGAGGAEMMGLIGDLWSASRHGLTVTEVASRHGYHGPMEGELSSYVWREDPAPLERLVREYASLAEEQDPRWREAERRRAGERLRPQLVAAFPRAIRPAVEGVLRLAAARIPLRGVAKVFLLQAFDVTRAAARRTGMSLAAEGRLEQPDDVFYLTASELRGALPGNARELVAMRREQRASYQRLELPSDWIGTPEPLSVAGAESGPGTGPRMIDGIGVSGGVVEGRVRVVLDAAADEIEPNEILVAPTTDPSWSSVMFISAGLVVDIGGALSHAAVVARELGIPCVVNTRSGTRTLQTGDLVRVDGDAGTVEILQPAIASTGSRR